MIPWDEVMLDQLLTQKPPRSRSTARRLWATLRDYSTVMLVRGKVGVAIGATLLVSGLGIIRTVILGLPWLVVCMTIAMFVGSWFFAGPTITVSSFVDTSGDKGGGLGQTIADALALELQRIDQLDTIKNPWGRAEEVHSVSVTTPQAYERVGTVNVGGTQLPVGELLLALKALLPHWHPHRIITGSIWRSSPAEGSPVRILVRLEEDGRILKHWSNSQEQKQPLTLDDVAIQKFVKNMAFEIMWSMGKGSAANSIEDFQSYVDGVEKFRRYKDMRNKNDFNDAERYFAAAIEGNPQYVKAYYYLGTLYSWRAFYEEAGAAVAADYEQKAREKYEWVKSKASPEAQALGHFGLGLLAYRHNRREQRMSPGHHDLMSPSNPKLQEAGQYFEEAIRLEPKLHFAQTGHALVYKEMGCVHKAIKEFQGARRRVQDKSSVMWIDEQIRTLQERQYREQQEIRKARTGESGRSRLLAVFNWSSAARDCA